MKATRPCPHLTSSVCTVCERLAKVEAENVELRRQLADRQLPL